MHVRRAAPGDRPFMMSLAGRLAGVADFPWRTVAELEAFQHSFMQAALDRQETVALIVEAADSGERLGFIALEPQADPITGAAGGYVSLLAVTQAAEGRGAARALVEAAEDVARAAGWTTLALDVFATNARGRRFYDAMGFREEAVRLVRPLTRPTD